MKKETDKINKGISGVKVGLAKSLSASEAILVNQVDAEIKANERHCMIQLLCSISKKTLTLKWALTIAIGLSFVQWVCSAGYGRYHSGLWFWETRAEVASLKIKLREESDARQRLAAENNKLDNELNVIKIDGLADVETLRRLRDHDGALIQSARLQNDRLSSENSRLNDELNNTRLKIKQHGETLWILRGVVLNKRSLIERGVAYNPYRPNGFPFSEWNSYWVEPMVRVIVAMENLDVAQWITEQPNWKSNVSAESMRLITSLLNQGQKVALMSYGTTDKSSSLSRSICCSLKKN